MKSIVYPETECQIFIPKHKIEATYLVNRKGRCKVEGYCVKCKSKKEMTNAKEITMKNKRKAMKGKCPECGTGMFRIMGK